MEVRGVYVLRRWWWLLDGGVGEALAGVMRCPKESIPGTTNYKRLQLGGWFFATQFTVYVTSKQTHQKYSEKKFLFSFFTNFLQNLKLSAQRTSSDNGR